VFLLAAASARAHGSAEQSAPGSRAVTGYYHMDAKSVAWIVNKGNLSQRGEATMPYFVARKDEEIDNLLNACCEQEEQGGSAVPGMSYEQGIKAAIEWLTDEHSDHPLE